MGSFQLELQTIKTIKYKNKIHSMQYLQPSLPYGNDPQLSQQQKPCWVQVQVQKQKAKEYNYTKL